MMLKILGKTVHRVGVQGASKAARPQTRVPGRRRRGLRRGRDQVELQIARDQVPEQGK